MRQPPAGPRQAFLDFVRGQVPSARGPIRPPASPEGWERRLDAVRAGLARALGPRPAVDASLEPEILGVVRRDGYAIERLTFQSRPGVRVTANLYRPDPAPAGRMPAVLHVHGHWPWARVDPHVQARAIGLARLGYVGLAVDAFGAGERAVDPGPGTYHGASTGAMLWPSGVPLIGLQVHDNRRAVDYLVTRPEVDPDRLAVTGASGGGNQSLYAGALDERLRAVVPVCGIGTYESYLGAGCCVCEVLPGGLAFATTGDLLALAAPRALLVINASRDAPQFSPGEAAKSLAYARARFDSLGAPDRVKHLVVDSGHDYNRTMREAMYGWLDRWLRGRGDGGPVPEPVFEPEEPRALLCYPDPAARPAAVVTIPRFAQAEGAALLAQLPPVADHPERFEADAERLRATLRDDVLGGIPARSELEPAGWADPPVALGPGDRACTIAPEPGLRLGGVFRPAPADVVRRGTALLLRPDGVAPADDPAVSDLRGAGWDVLSVELRATGTRKPDTGAVRGVADHNEAEWAVWIGRPLLGQWAHDVRRWLDALEVPPVGGPETHPEGEIALVGMGAAAAVALTAAVLDPRPDRVVLAGGPVSLVGDRPFDALPMGLLAPGLLEVGDIGHLAGLVAPRPLAVAGGIEPDGRAVEAGRLSGAYAPALAAYAALDAPGSLRVVADAGPLGGLLEA